MPTPRTAMVWTGQMWVCGLTVDGSAFSSGMDKSSSGGDQEQGGSSGFEREDVRRGGAVSEDARGRRERPRSRGGFALAPCAPCESLDRGAAGLPGARPAGHIPRAMRRRGRCWRPHELPAILIHRSSQPDPSHKRRSGSEVGRAEALMREARDRRCRPPRARRRAASRQAPA